MVEICDSWSSGYIYPVARLGFPLSLVLLCAAGMVAYREVLKGDEWAEAGGLLVVSEGISDRAAPTNRRCPLR
jgi:hypothetical protein